MGKTNLLITGNLNASVWSLSALLAEHGFRVTVAAGGLKPAKRQKDQYSAPVSDWNADLSRVYRAGGFHTVIFFYSCSSEQVDPDGEESRFGSFLDMLRRNLSLTDLFPEVTRFILVTDQRVFGTEQEKNEETVPQPDTYEGRMIRLAEEELERKERSGKRLEKLLVRTTHLYDNRKGEGAASSFSLFSGAVRFPGTADSVCDLLSRADFNAFLLQAATGDQNGTVHVFQGIPVSYRELSDFFAAAGTGFIPAGIRKDRTLLSGTAAWREFDWVSRDFFPEESFEEKKEAVRKGKGGLISLLRLRGRFGKLAAPVETAAGILAMQLLLLFTESHTAFEIVDVRLLLPVVIGTVHGAVWGLAAAFAAWLSYCASFLSGGGEAWDLLLNMDNWLPLILYLLAGEITGYIRTSSRARITELEQELKGRTEDLDFLRRLHQSACDQRDMLAEQVINSRDSYGRVYTMVSELDVLNPDEISFRAVRILEEVLDCRSVEVYYRTGEGSFLRRIAESPREQPENQSYSLNLEEAPELMAALEKDGIFVNRDLRAGLPAYAASQSMGGGLTLAVLLREVEYRQFSRYYQNLFRITVSLISRAMKRAVEYQNDPDRYLPGTILLKPEEFISAWRIRRQMRQEHMGSYVLFRISPALPDTVLSERLKSCVRSLDLAGKTPDGTRFLLLMQSDRRYVPMLLKRFESHGIPAEPAEDTDLCICS